MGNPGSRAHGRRRKKRAWGRGQGEDEADSAPGAKAETASVQTLAKRVADLSSLDFCRKLSNVGFLAEPKARSCTVRTANMTGNKAGRLLHDVC